MWNDEHILMMNTFFDILKGKFLVQYYYHLHYYSCFLKNINLKTFLSIIYFLSTLKSFIHVFLKNILSYFCDLPAGFIA